MYEKVSRNSREIQNRTATSLPDGITRTNPVVKIPFLKEKAKKTQKNPSQRQIFRKNACGNAEKKCEPEEKKEISSEKVLPPSILPLLVLLIVSRKSLEVSNNENIS